MRCPSRFRGFLPFAVVLSVATLSASACTSGESAEAGAVGTTASDPLVVTFSQTFLTVENRSGVPIVEGEMQIVPRGVMPPFRTRLSRIEGTGRVELPYSQFYSRDGTPFRRGITRTRNVRLTATDVAGKKFDMEVPFD
jgi:hypothetical protein